MKRSRANTAMHTATPTSSGRPRSSRSIRWPRKAGAYGCWGTVYEGWLESKRPNFGKHRLVFFVRLSTCDHPRVNHVPIAVNAELVRGGATQPTAVRVMH